MLWSMCAKESTSSLSSREEVDEEESKKGAGLVTEESWEREEQEELLKLPARGLVGSLGRWWQLVILESLLRLTLGLVSMVMARPLAKFDSSSKIGF